MNAPKKNLKSKGNEYFKQGEYNMAINMYKKYVANHHSDNKNAFYNIALCYFKCIEACKEALRIDENYLKVYYRLALAYDKIDNQYQAYAIANEFCMRSREQRDTEEYREMEALAKNRKSNITYPSPVQIQARLRYLVEINQYSNKDKQKQKQKEKEKQAETEYFKGYSWLDVQKDIDQGMISRAVNKAYGICKNSNTKNKSINYQNLTTVKAIKQGKLSKDAKIVTDITQLQKKLNQQSKELKKSAAEILPIQPSQIQSQQPSACPLVSSLSTPSILQMYKFHFQTPLEKSLDIFQAFASVISLIVQNKTLSISQKEQILTHTVQNYAMFTALQMSMSDGEKKKLRKKMTESKINDSIVGKYCQ